MSSTRPAVRVTANQESCATHQPVSIARPISVRFRPRPIARAIATLSALSGLGSALAANPEPAAIAANDAAQVGAGSPSSAPSADPASTEATQLQSVVVTGRNSNAKKSESVESVPGAELENNAVPDITTLLQSVPGVALKTEGVGQTEIEMRGLTSSGGYTATSGFYLDDIALSPPAGAQNGKVVVSPALYDLQGVDVLRGPQGTSFGAGAMGGAIRLVTTTPDPGALAGSVQSIVSGTSGGGLNHTNNFMVNLPLSQDVAALRIVGSEAHTSGWIDRIVSNAFPVATDNGATRGDVASAPVSASYKDSNAAQQYNLRMNLLLKPTSAMTIVGGFYYFRTLQDGISAFDNTPGTQTHYQPFDIAEPLTDRMSVGTVTVNYAFEKVDLTWNTSYWTRRSIQVQDGSEDFNNVQSGATLASNNDPSGPQPGYYGPGGTGRVIGTENDPTRQLSTELRIASKGDGPFQWVAGTFASDYRAVWNFSGITENPSVYMDLGTNQAATTNEWFVANSPTHSTQLALFGDGEYAVDDHLKLELGGRLYHYHYSFTSTITGWGSGFGEATPSTTGKLRLGEFGFNPKTGVSYRFDRDLMAYATVSRGSRPGGGNAPYPTTGTFWSAAYAPMNYTNGWPTTYGRDSVWTYEIGEKARFLDRRLSVDVSAYYEDWKDPELLAYPGDWAFNVNGKRASIVGSELNVKAILGGGFVVGVSGGYTHANVSPGDHWEILPRNVMPDLPLFNGEVALTYQRSLGYGTTLTAGVDGAYVGSRYTLSFLYPYSSTAAYAKLPSYVIANAHVNLESEKGWGVGVFVNNFTNKRASLEYMFQETEPSAAFTRVLTNQPRTAGVNLTYRM